MRLKALVTAGPTREPIDPVRYISNYSSGRQGYAIAEALDKAGVEVTLVSGPVSLPVPPAVHFHAVETAEQMLKACTQALPVDIVICAAAVSDWKVAHPAAQKLKKQSHQEQLIVSFVKNPDILKTLSTHPDRPALVVGFALESEQLLAYAQAKLKEKQCDWIIANAATALGTTDNQVSILQAEGALIEWPVMKKTEIADKLATLAIEYVTMHHSFKRE